jgi:glycosyltransferase involved in cell wall biosynthesis
MNAVTVAGNNSGYAGVMQGIGALSIVNPLDTEDFARRLHLLIHEPALRASWSKWAKQYVKMFDWQKVVDQYEELYRDALKQHAHKR